MHISRPCSHLSTLTAHDNVTLADAGFPIASLTPSKGTCSFNAGTNLVSCTVGTLTAGEVQTLTIVARPTFMASPPSPRQMQNTATVATTTPESDSTNNSKSATLDILPAQVDLIANISDVPSGSA